MPITADHLKPIKLTEAQSRQLGGVLTEIVREMESTHAGYFNNIRQQWKWYWAEPKQAKKQHPWPGAANVVAPVIMTQADARTAQDFAMLYSTKDKLYSGDSENETFARDYLSEVLNFGNWTIDNEVRPFWTLLDWITERNVLGYSVFAATWVEDRRYMFAPGDRRPRQVITRRGARWDHWPAEKILWTPGRDIRDSDRIITQRLLSHSDLACMLASEQGYDHECIKKLLGHPHEHGSPGAEIQAEKEDRAGVDPSLNVSFRPNFDIRTLWIDFPAIPGLGIKGLADAAIIEVEDEEGIERTQVPLIVELAPDNQSVLRVLPNQYLTAEGHNFFGAYYKRQVGMPRGVGIAKTLEQLQRAESAVICQALDARTLQNAMPFKTTDPQLKERPITPGQGLYVTDMGSVDAFPIPGANPMDLSLANFLHVFAERIGGSNDPVMGRESRSGGHPSPATNYMGQLQQSAKMAATPTLILGQVLAEAGVYTLSLYQQFDTDPSGRIERVFGKADAAKVQEWLFPTDMTMAGNLNLSLTALSDDNPQAVMQKAMTVSQVTQMYFGNILKLIQVMSSPQVPDPVKKASLQALQVLGDTHQKFLEASDYDEAREAILRLDQGDLSAIQQLSAIAQQSGAQGGGGGGPGQNPGGPGPSSPGGPGPNGATPPPGAAQGGILPGPPQ